MYVVWGASWPDGVNSRTRPIGALGLEIGAVMGVLSSGNEETEIEPATDGVIRKESAIDAGSIGASNTIPMGPRILAPATFGAGTVVTGARPAATVVNVVEEAEPRWLPSVSTAPSPTVMV